MAGKPCCAAAASTRTNEVDSQNFSMWRRRAAAAQPHLTSHAPMHERHAAAPRPSACELPRSSVAAARIFDHSLQVAGSIPIIPSRLGRSGMAQPITADTCHGSAPSASHELRSAAKSSTPWSGIRWRSRGLRLSMPRALPELRRRKPSRTSSRPMGRGEGTRRARPRILPHAIPLQRLLLHDGVGVDDRPRRNVAAGTHLKAMGLQLLDVGLLDLPMDNPKLLLSRFVGPPHVPVPGPLEAPTHHPVTPSVGDRRQQLDALEAWRSLLQEDAGAHAPTVGLLREALAEVLLVAVLRFPRARRR
ncbi:unnamed protein product [Prorocentrum cordatum]|uniref:Uncharacterized protein n=1 Tax=Prorocentrum cordatum TaxID=2364126 RepID=A0ABN9TB67_9DINO|nr:unnamed protein product [Polarella glacialis]